jgi:uncharacterized protein (TIGR02246 family)
MKKWFVFVFCICFSLASISQKNDEAAIRDVMDAQVRAWNNGNIDAFMETYWKSDSMLFIGASGVTDGWQSTIKHYKQRYPDTAAMGKLDFEILQVKLLSRDYAFVLGRWHLTRSIGDTGGYFTLLFKKIKMKWFIIVDHTS